MSHIVIAAKAADRDLLMEALRDLGILHLVPLQNAPRDGSNPAEAEVQRIRRALQILSKYRPAGPEPEFDGEEATARALDLQKRLADNASRLDALALEATQAEPWAHTSPRQIRALADAGVDIQLALVPDAEVAACQADLVEPLRHERHRRTLVALANPAELPPSAQVIARLERSRAEILAEAKELEQDTEAIHTALHHLAALRPKIESYLSETLDRKEWIEAADSGLAEEDLYALQGWIPAARTGTLVSDLAERGVTAAVRSIEPPEGETPPTSISPPAWARPIQALFRMLGTVPGYREFDVSVPFMIALPIFAAILIGDGGYGLLLILPALLARRWMHRVAGRDATMLVLLVGITSLIWGFLSSNFFGFRLYRPVIPVDLTEHSRYLMMLLSFILGAVHLSVAQLWQAVTYYPDRRFLGRVGWALFIWGMFGVVLHFVLRYDFGWNYVWPYLLISGAVLAVLFARNERGLFRSLALGVADFPLSMISAFSDVISYVRLMAVGLATTVLAVAFNEMAIAAGLLPFGMLIFLLGHGLNFGLVIIALFAHGVRLNMLEFSTNLGMQWSGYPFRPFSAHFRK